MATVNGQRVDGHDLRKEKKATFGMGLLKGMRVTLMHLFKRNTVIEYPDVRRDLPSRTRGVIALKEENCTVCMLCARECPDWCIYIDSHKETLPPKRAGGRPRKRNVLDRFAIDYALCMYCGICVEVCPYDALFWSREFEYSEFDIRELTHEKERLADWMATVLPPPPLEEGAVLPGAPASEPLAAGAAGPGSAQRPAPPTAVTAAQERPEQAAKATAAAPAPAPAPAAASQSQRQAGETASPRASGGAATEEKVDLKAGEASMSDVGVPIGTTGPDTDAVSTRTESTSERAAVERDEAAAPPDDGAATRAESTTTVQPGATKPGDAQSAAPPAGREPDSARYHDQPGPNVEVPQEPPRPVALERIEDPEAVYRQVLQEQLDRGSSPQVAEARAKVARVKAERGIRRGPAPAPTQEPVPSAPPEGHETPPEPSGAPRAESPQPDPGPVAPAPAEATREPMGVLDEDPEAVYERVLAEERAKGSSDAVAVGRAKAARVRAERARRGR